MSRLGELLVRENLISLQQLQKAQEAQRKTGGRLGMSLIKQGILSAEQLTNFLARQYGVPAINLGDFEVDPEVIKLIPVEVAKKHQVVPVNRAGSSLIVAMSDPSNIPAIDDLKFLTGYNIEVVVASEVQIEEAVARYYEKTASYAEVLGDIDVDEIDLANAPEELNVVDLEKASTEAPVIKLCNVILVNAIKKGASDI